MSPLVLRRTNARELRWDLSVVQLELLEQDWQQDEERNFDEIFENGTVVCNTFDFALVCSRTIFLLVSE